MSDFAEFKLDPTTARLLDKALVNSIGIEKKSAIDTVVRLSIGIASSARAATKQGKQYRDIRQNPEWKPRSGITRYQIIRRIQPKGERYLPKKTRKKKGDPRVLIANRGLAKRSWGWALFRLGKPLPKRANYRRKAKRTRIFVRVSKNLKSKNPAVIIKILLTYILKMHPTIVRDSIRKASNKIIKLQERKLARKIQRQIDKGGR